MTSQNFDMMTTVMPKKDIFWQKKILLQNLVTFLSQIFPENFLTKKWLNSAVKFFFCQKMHIYGITVVIISKLCEVMKSETKIVLINYNTHVHTLSKKIFFFWISSFLAKTKGGAGHLVPKKRTFLGRQKFLADYVAGGPKIWSGEKKLLVWPGSSRIFYLNQKQKSYVTLKSVNSNFLKNRVGPPFETNANVRNTFTWHAITSLKFATRTRTKNNIFFSFFFKPNSNK